MTIQVVDSRLDSLNIAGPVNKSLAGNTGLAGQLIYKSIVSFEKL